MRNRHRRVDSNPEVIQTLREQGFRKKHVEGKARLAELILNGGVDLHLHSTASDGSDSPPALLQAVMANGLRAYALTDHDGIAGLRTMHLVRDKLAKLGVDLPEFVPGVEVSANYQHEGEDQEIHLLVYFPVGGVEELQPFLQEHRKNRDARNRLMCERLQELGMNVTFEDLQGEGGEVIGRPHVATIMIRKGYVNSHRDAFDLWLGEGRPAYVQRDLPSVADVIATARDVGAVIVLAHPSLYAGWMDDMDILRERFKTLQLLGLDGVELFQNETDRADASAIAEIACSLNMLPTVGSDYHGKNKTDIPMLKGDQDMSDLLDPFEDILRDLIQEVREDPPAI